MSCKDCDDAQESGSCYYLRVGDGNVAIICCKKHFKELTNKYL